MSLKRRLATIIEGMPDGGAVTLPVQWVRHLLDSDTGVTLPEESVTDMSVREVAEALDRSQATVRGWCFAGEIPGAYKLKGREWRIPHRGLREFLDGQGDQQSTTVLRHSAADLRAWRAARREAK